ncbi:MAG TPA: sensor domain-containing diguanylate cyclase [Kofleriaceae bacterium]|nr:sensor domain-containing diguanylate cyclase [Kofleriaceae bacterium]
MSAPDRRQLVFTLALAVLGWGAVVAAAIVAPPALPVHGGLGVALFVGVIVATRALAFPIAPGAVLSLDSGFYVAAAVALGPTAAALIVALALTADAAVRWWRARAARPDDEHRRGLAYVAFFGGATGALVGGIAEVVSRVAPTGSAGGELATCLRVVAIGVALLVVHNLLQGARLALGGRPLRRFVREQAAPGILAELSLLPVAAVAAQLFADGRLLGFTLLAATHLLLNLIFNRLARASAAGRARVRELELLDRTARALGSSIELPQVVATVAREAVTAIPAAEAVALVHRGAARETDRLVVDSYDRERDRHARVVVPRGEGATGQVIRLQAALRVDDLAGSDLALGPAAGPDGVRSWLGVPVMLHGACEGVLAVQSRQPAAFTDADERLLGSLALQVGAALANAHLYEMAMVDGLTGLFVRRYFDARLDEEIERARRYRTPFAVAMLDLDDFKRLNDEHGHLVGDRVLREIASVVRTEVRGVDTAARYGGEELALILPGTELVAALGHAERVRHAIAERRVASGDGGPVLSITASVGIAAFPDSGAASAEDLLRRADRALYRAKRAGKNRVELYWADDSGKHAVLDDGLS